MRPAKWFCTHVFVFSCLLFCGRIHYVMCNTTYVIRKDNTDKFGSVHNPNECFRKYANIVYVAAKECQCPYAKSTYFHFKNACVNNYYFENELKTQSVCPGGLLRIQSEPYPVFDLTNSSSSSLKYVKTFDSQCSLENLHYLDESSGKLINAGSLIAKLFSLEKRTKTTVHLLWRSTYVSSFLKGRVVLLEFNKNCKVEMQFSSPSFGTKPCIIFKSLGTLTFNQSPTWSSSPPSNHRKRNKTEKSSSIKGLIVGPLVIFLGVVVLVLIVVLIYRKVRQKSRQRVNATQNSNELADDFDMDGNPRSNVSQTSNQSGAEEMYMNTIPDLPSDPPANAANISTNAHGNSQTVELQEPELYASMKDDVLQYDYASVNGVPGSNQNIPKGMQQIPGAFEYDYASVNGAGTSFQSEQIGRRNATAFNPRRI
ncbi:uncharacterized protein LOC110251123 isoform X2 [Exaiptasia diaphana]|uniref:Uncharacterized protein n=1 Tax=Exaiptasia diaphana TaxID=2652724 RepID=A0A913YT04_EXADI|nr:uncharacterized protein LOC110251123 isoform X2 [Exaiptasia diaphana]